MGAAEQGPCRQDLWHQPRQGAGQLVGAGASPALPEDGDGPRMGKDLSSQTDPAWLGLWPGRTGLWVAADQPRYSIVGQELMAPGACNGVLGTGSANEVTLSRLY